MAWSASSNFVWSCGSKLLRVINDVYLDDVSYQIKARAKARYGLQVSIIKICLSKSYIYSVRFHILENMKSVSEKYSSN